MKILPILILLNTFIITNAHGLVEKGDLNHPGADERLILDGVSDEEKISIIRSYLVRYFPDTLLLDRICEINDQLVHPIPPLSQQCYETTGSEQQLSDQEKVNIIRAFFIRPDHFHYDENMATQEENHLNTPCEINPHSMDPTLRFSEQCYERAVYYPMEADTNELTTPL